MKTTAVLALLFLAAAGPAPAAATPAPAKAACCAEKPAVQKDACCAESPAGAAKTCGCTCCAQKTACCAAKTAASPEAACCKTGAPATDAFSQESLYQLDVTFTNDAGKTVALGELRGRPVVLDLFFASCGYACPLTVTDMLAIQARLPAALRRETVFVLVSFDVARDTPAALAEYRAKRGLDAQWVLLHGSDDAVRELAALVGVKYKQEADGAFSHSNLVTLLNRRGEIVHQRVGLKGGLDEATAALITAAAAQ